MMQSMNKTQIMGILNITPDSFSDGGEAFTTQNAISKAQQMLADGAEILDIGGESTAPGSAKVTTEEEWQRLQSVLLPIIELGTPVSIDTYKAEIAKRTLQLGAKMINDVTAFRGDEQMIEILRKADCEITIMYSKDYSPRTTLDQKEYEDVIVTIGDFLAERLAFAQKNGIDPQRIILDPGMGAFVSAEPKYSFELLRRLPELKQRFSDNRVLIGTSRKGFLQSLAPNAKSPKKRLIPSVVSALIAAQSSADILRVHDVRETMEAITTWEAIQERSCVF
jgi:dihydropteroate synthase